MILFPSQQRTVATIGLPGHGKTVFLASLFWDSFFALSQTLRDERQPYAVRAVTPRADEFFYGNALTLDKLTLPPANPRTRPEPAMLEFQGVPHARYGSWRRKISLLFYDIAGEVFENDALTREYAPFLTHADDIIFLFDPTHPEFSALSAARLVDLVYRVTGRRRRNLIIALSKMDELRAREEWAGMIEAYWPDDPPAPGKHLHRYIGGMEQLSATLRNSWWMAPEQQAHNVINSLPRRNTHFCAVSSLGHQPVQDEAGHLRLTEKPAPFRVRDPLFWIFRAAGVM